MRSLKKLFFEEKGLSQLPNDFLMTKHSPAEQNDKKWSCAVQKYAYKLRIEVNKNKPSESSGQVHFYEFFTFGLKI